MMTNVSVGDYVIVPHAYAWKWEPTTIVIDDIRTEDNEKVYYAECAYDNMFSSKNNHDTKTFRFEEDKLFPNTFEGLEACKEYIDNYYYAGYCANCKYNKWIEDFFCKDCVHCETERKSATDNTLYRCKINGSVVGCQYQTPIGKEICKYYESVLPQEQALFRSWDDYIDVLKNCDFNKECPTHKLSCHKTCDYERYLNQLIRIGLSFSFTFEERKVNSIKILRKRWMEQEFLDGNLLKCAVLNFDYKKNKRGLPRKEDQPISKSWEIKVTEDTPYGIWTSTRCKEVIIDIEKGIVVGETGEYV